MGKTYTRTDRFSGMLLVGEAMSYLYHLPMFISPHNYQAILEVTLSTLGSNPMAVYLADRQATGRRCALSRRRSTSFSLISFLRLRVIQTGRRSREPFFAVISRTATTGPKAKSSSATSW